MHADICAVMLRNGGLLTQAQTHNTVINSVARAPWPGWEGGQELPGQNGSGDRADQGHVELTIDLGHNIWLQGGPARGQVKRSLGTLPQLS